jgi:hypothetical protein
MSYTINDDTIIFDDEFNRSLDPYFNILSKYPKLFLGKYFDQRIDNLPNTITHLTFDYHSKFNQQVNNLSQNLIYVQFGWDFNQFVDFLPQNLRHLIFGVNFNQSIDNLPRNLIFLFLGKMFNKSIDNLPDNLTRLCIGENFNQLIKYLPYNLEIIKVFEKKYKINIKDFGFVKTHDDDCCHTFELK